MAIVDKSNVRNRSGGGDSETEAGGSEPGAAPIDNDAPGDKSQRPYFSRNRLPRDGCRIVASAWHIAAHLP